MLLLMEVDDFVLCFNEEKETPRLWLEDAVMIEDLEPVRECLDARPCLLWEDRLWW